MSTFHSDILGHLIADLEGHPLALAAWEGGSAANGTSDEYSDIDLVVVATQSTDAIFQSIESTLNRVGTITHTRPDSSQSIEAFFQRVYFLEGAPEHFFVDVGVCLQTSGNVLWELLNQERHGTPVVHFDKRNLVQPRTGDLKALRAEQRRRLAVFEDGFPLFRVEVLKSLDRGNAIDAFHFYGHIVRSLVEMLGMLHRPHQYDFGLRYIHQAFPAADQTLVRDLLFVGSGEEIRHGMARVDALFPDVAARVKQHLDT